MSRYAGAIDHSAVDVYTYTSHIERIKKRKKRKEKKEKEQLTLAEARMLSESVICFLQRSKDAEQKKTNGVGFLF